MFGKEKFETIFKRIDEIEVEIKDIRNQLDNEIKIIEKAGKPISNELTDKIDGTFYNNPLKDLTQEINSYFDSVISKANLKEIILRILKKYELDVKDFRNYIVYLEEANMIKGMMDHNGEALHPIYSIVRDKKIPDKTKEDRGIFDELDMS